MKKILIADDHNIVRRGVAQLLQLSIPSAEITEASSGNEMLLMVSSGRWDLVITDNSMPDINGIDIIPRIKQIDASIPVLVFSMFQENQYGIRSIRAGASEYVCKEYADTELLNAVARILSGKKYISSQIA